MKINKGYGNSIIHASAADRFFAGNKKESDGSIFGYYNKYYGPNCSSSRSSNTFFEKFYNFASIAMIAMSAFSFLGSIFRGAGSRRKNNSTNTQGQVKGRENMPQNTKAELSELSNAVRAYEKASKDDKAVARASLVAELADVKVQYRNNQDAIKAADTTIKKHNETMENFEKMMTEQADIVEQADREITELRLKLDKLYTADPRDDKAIQDAEEALKNAEEKLKLARNQISAIQTDRQAAEAEYQEAIKTKAQLEKINTKLEAEINDAQRALEKTQEKAGTKDADTEAKTKKDKRAEKREARKAEKKSQKSDASFDEADATEEEDTKESIVVNPNTYSYKYKNEKLGLIEEM